MKKIILTLAILIFTFSNISAQWEILNEGFKDWTVINTMDFVNEYTGWLAGSNGTLCKTSDGGINWSDIPIDESWSINHLDFINESIGWGVVSKCDSVRCYAVIIKSLDEGITWQVQKQINDIGLNRIFVIDENYAFAIGDRIYKTSDGGINWANITPVYNSPYYSIWFSDSLNGVVTGNYWDDYWSGTIIMNTTNGGTNWYRKNASVSFNALQFINDKIGYFFYQKDTVTCFCRTNDMLSSWKILAEIDGYMSSFQAVDTDFIYATGSFREGTLIKSTDGGITWQNLLSGYSAAVSKNAMNIEGTYGKAPLPVGINLSGIYIFGNNLGLIIGDIGWGNPVLYRSTDLEDWKLRRFSFPLNDVSFFNQDKGLIAGGWFSGGPGHCGSGGCMLSTDNSGIDWFVNSPSRINYQSCLFLDETTAFIPGISCGSASILKTNNSGNTWTEYNLSDTLGNYFWPSDICFDDINNGFTVGRYLEEETSGAGIIQTTDQGENWELIFKYPNTNVNWYNLPSICFNGTTGWAVGERGNYNDGQTSGVIFKYTPQTGWVKKDPVISLPLNKVFFTDENHGWIAGGYYNEWESMLKSVCLKTTDGGESWQINEKLPYLINNFYFTDNGYGCAVGNDCLGKGVILESTDAGDNWNVTIDNLMSHLKSIYVKDNFVWAVGDNGLILRNTNAGVVWVEDENNNSLPTVFILEQNYPNPFNPNTVISYQLPVSGDVTLKVYDILGNEIATLVDEFKQAWRYEVEFNTAVLPSGVYFYQLKTGEYTAVKKMLLLK